MSKPLLSIDHLTMRFGGLTAVNDLSFEIRKGEITALIGPNGAGKTTVFNMITGLYVPSGGDILLQGESVIGMEPFEITQAGIGRTFQNIRLFANMTAGHIVVLALIGLIFSFGSYVLAPLPLAMAVAMENLDIIEERGLMQRVPQLSPRFLERLHAFSIHGHERSIANVLTLGRP